MTLIFLQLRRVGGLDHDFYHLSCFCRLSYFLTSHDYMDYIVEIFVVCNDNMFVNRFGICM
jgi:hypothetical protein